MLARPIICFLVNFPNPKNIQIEKSNISSYFGKHLDIHEIFPTNQLVTPPPNQIQETMYGLCKKIFFRTWNSHNSKNKFYHESYKNTLKYRLSIVDSFLRWTTPTWKPNEISSWLKSIPLCSDVKFQSFSRHLKERETET